MPSLLRRLHREHLARQQRLTARAVPDAGLHMHNGRPVRPPITPVIVRLEPLTGWVTGHFANWWQWTELPVDSIIRVVCHHYQITHTDLISHRLDRQATHARQVAMHLLRTLTPLTLLAIAHVLGKTDHSTVAHGVRMIAAQLEHDADLVTEIRTLKQRLGVT
jgi:hypothetical protein